MSEIDALSVRGGEAVGVNGSVIVLEVLRVKVALLVPLRETEIELEGVRVAVSGGLHVALRV